MLCPGRPPRRCSRDQRGTRKRKQRHAAAEATRALARLGADAGSRHRIAFRAEARAEGLPTEDVTAAEGKMRRDEERAANSRPGQRGEVLSGLCRLRTTRGAAHAARSANSFGVHRSAARSDTADAFERRCAATTTPIQRHSHKRRRAACGLARLQASALALCQIRWNRRVTDLQAAAGSVVRDSCWNTAHELAARPWAGGGG